jgi:hypothetical protein
MRAEQLFGGVAEEKNQKLGRMLMVVAPALLNLDACVCDGALLSFQNIGLMTRLASTNSIHCSRRPDHLTLKILEFKFLRLYSILRILTRTMGPSHRLSILYEFHRRASILFIFAD